MVKGRNEWDDVGEWEDTEAKQKWTGRLKKRETNHQQQKFQEMRLSIPPRYLFILSQNSPAQPA